jgi:hypothetical protein
MTRTEVVDALNDLASAVMIVQNTEHWLDLKRRYLAGEQISIDTELARLAGRTIVPPL